MNFRDWLMHIFHVSEDDYQKIKQDPDKRDYYEDLYMKDCQALGWKVDWGGL